MKKTVSALAFAVLALCVAGSVEAKTKAHKTTKAAAVKVATRNSPAGAAYLQCVTFARQFTGMQIFGDAWTWWEKATGRYEEGTAPRPGAVLVFRQQGKMSRGHVAVVSQIITDRYIQVTHANWSPINGRRGQVEDNVNVLDVSEKGDWSLVKVWYGPTNDLGTTVYTTYGFIYQDPNNVRMGDDVTTMIAQAEPVAAPKPAATQIAMNTAPVASPSAKDLPADLQAALTPGNHKGFQSVKPVQVTAHVTGKPAAELVAQIDADNEAAGRPVVKVKAPSAKATKSKSRVRTKLKD
ncbi:CHAP domain-containing protein [Asticcacaulis sp. 201]|uniref:CHAP domain-containing protein n=1 Tax=Asticcacaulis sp. 201 TaxID=3028787 RepID=UPI0029162AAF|nr:CHAP domain-containing protein [Asticcacaulis sp. 201]MDV6332446.1 CHAP domain-containing protein [Asticcacaulis sp. 201]